MNLLSLTLQYEYHSIWDMHLVLILCTTCTNCSKFVQSNQTEPIIYGYTHNNDDYELVYNILTLETSSISEGKPKWEKNVNEFSGVSGQSYSVNEIKFLEVYLQKKKLIYYFF